MGICDFKTEIAGAHFLFQKVRTICGKQLQLLVVSQRLLVQCFGVWQRQPVMRMISGELAITMPIWEFERNCTMKESRYNIVDPKASIPGRNYHPEKPSSCVYCCYWISGKKGCKRKQCYYLLPEQKELEKEVGDCENCPYGKYSPCIGYCIAQLLAEVRQQKGR